MADYGVNVYFGESKILANERLGLAFDVVKNGRNADYSTAPNRYSQTEFVKSPLREMWGVNQEEVVKQFTPETYVSNGSSVSSVKDYNYVKWFLESSYVQSHVAYSHNHITSADLPLVGLTNNITIEKKVQVDVPAVTYGIFTENNFINTSLVVDCYKLTGVQIYRGSPVGRVRAGNPRELHNSHPHIVVVPCHYASEIVAVCPENFDPNITVTLFAQSAVSCVFILFCAVEPAVPPALKVYRYSVHPSAPLYPNYGFRLRNAEGKVCLTSENPPLIPLWVANTDKLGQPPETYPLAVVFSRVSTLLHKDVAPNGSVSAVGSFLVTNGIRWQTPVRLVGEITGVASHSGFTLGLCNEKAFRETVARNMYFPYIGAYFRTGAVKWETVSSVGSHLAVIAY